MCSGWVVTLHRLARAVVFVTSTSNKYIKKHWWTSIAPCHLCQNDDSCDKEEDTLNELFPIRWLLLVLGFITLEWFWSLLPCNFLNNTVCFHEVLMYLTIKHGEEKIHVERFLRPKCYLGRQTNFFTFQANCVQVRAKIIFPRRRKKSRENEKAWRPKDAMQ